jgi:hypoxanthine phosphoribosyltransferase
LLDSSPLFAAQGPGGGWFELRKKFPTHERFVHDDIQEVLLSEERILAGIDRLAATITRAYSGSDLVVVSVLKGSCIFASDLIRRLPIPLQLGFVSAGSYGRGTQSGQLDIQLMPSEEDVLGRRVLLVDDILDTGRTLSAVARELRECGCADVRTCVFLDKPGRRAVAFEADYRAFEVDDVFVVGYGLDFAGMYRNLPYVATLKPEVVAAAPSLADTTDAGEDAP